MNQLSVALAMRVGAATAFATVFAYGWVTDGYEPGAEWIMPLAVIGFGASIARWRVLLLAVIPVLAALPQGTEGDPPAVPAAIALGLIGAGLLTVGVAIAKALTSGSQDGGRR